MQEDKIETQDFKEKEFKKNIIAYLKQHKGAATIPQIMVGLGLHRDWVELVVRKLLDIYPCQVSIDPANIQALYLFDFSKKRISFWKRFRLILLQILKQILSIIWILAWGILFLSFYFLASLIFGMIFIANMPLMLFTLPILAFFIDLKSFEKKTNYYFNHFGDAVVGYKLMQWNMLADGSFLFGKTKDRLIVEKQILNFIQQNGGTISLAEIIQITGWNLNTAREQAIQLVSQFQGSIEVNEAGFLVYVFEELKGETKDTSYFPRIWRNSLPYYYLNVLNPSQFREMLWNVSLTIIYASGHLLVVLSLLMLNVHHPEEYTGQFIFLALPIIILIFSYLIMFLRYLWYLYLNKRIKKENAQRNMIKLISESQGILQSEKAIPSFCAALGGQAQVDEHGNMYYVFDEFRNPDLPLSKSYNTCILYERFGNNLNKWAEKDDSNVSLKIENRKYHFLHKRDTGAWETQIACRIDYTKPYFKIETSIAFKDGSEDGRFGGYGLLFGGYNFTSRYKFLIASVGQFCILNTKEDEKNTILNWTESEHIRQGTASNTLTVLKEKGDYIFLINQAEVHRCPFLPFYGNNVGFVTNYRMEIVVEYLYVEQQQ